VSEKSEDIEPDSAPSAWLRSLGIEDRESGIERASAARQYLIKAARKVLGASPEYTTLHLAFSGFVARAQGLHEGSVAAISANNPYATFTLLRAYSENAAAILYLKDHPTKLDSFWRNPKGVKIGSITNYAVKRFDGFKPIYTQLSEYAHPARRSILASTKATEDGHFTWSSSPSFKSEDDSLTACAWVVELAQATSHLLVELGDVMHSTSDQMGP